MAHGLMGPLALMAPGTCPVHPDHWLDFHQNAGQTGQFKKTPNSPRGSELLSGAMAVFTTTLSLHKLFLLLCPLLRGVSPLLREPCQEPRAVLPISTNL